MYRFKYKTNKYWIAAAIILCLVQTSIYAEVTETATVTDVTSVLSSIKINEQLPAFGYTTLTVTGTYSNGTSSLITSGIVWESSNANIAVVDSSGNVAFTGRGGSVTITASYGGKSSSVSVTTQQTPAASSYITVNGLPNYCEKDSSYTLTVQAVYSDNSVEVINNSYVKFVSSDTSIASVNSEGVVTVNGSLGGFVITATYRDKIAICVSVVNTTGWVPTYYTSTGEIIGIKILGEMPKEPFQPKKLEVKGEYSDGYYRALPNTVTWTTSNSNVVDVNSEGRISYGGQYGTATITAKYSSYEDHVKIEIGKGQIAYERDREEAMAKALKQERQKAFFNDIVVDANSIAATLEKLDTANQNTNSFRDIKGHWAEKEIKTAAALGIVSGFADNTFRPDSKITRGEFAAMICKAFSVRYYIDDSDKIFDDVAGKWHQNYVMALKNSGIISGYTDGTFKPNNSITRGEMIAIISRLIVKEDIIVKNSSAKYNDIPKGYWAKGYIDKLYSIGALDAIGSKKLEPDKKAARAEVVSVIVKLFQYIDENSK